MQRGRKILDTKSSELLLSKLRQIQKKEGFLSEENLKKLSLKSGIPLTKIYEVATFYSFFDVKKKGKHIIRLCNSPACLINGSENIQNIFQELLGIGINETTKDGKFTLKQTSCIGCCDEAPACLIDGKAYTKLDEIRIREIIKKCK